MMADKEDSDEERRERIKAVIENIRTRSKKLKKKARVPAIKKVSEPKEKEEMDAAKQEKGKQKASGRHTMYKLHIGWRHHCQGDFRQITSRRGGGIRKMEYNIKAPQSVESITEVGKRLFFPNGRNSFGNLNDMEVNLTNYSGEKIERFCNIDGQPCTFQEFLKSTGRYSSQFHVYLSTKSITDDKIKPLEATSETSYLANRKTIQELHVQYTKNKTSAYSGDTSIVTCHTTKECRELSGIPDDIDDYKPLEDGYNVTYLAVNDKVYMERTSSGHSFPQDVARQDSAYLFHGPSEICGMNEGKVVLGVITNCSEDVNYTWYKDQSIYAAGINLNSIHTNDTGVYNVKCQVGETLYTFEESVEIALPIATASDATCNSASYDMKMRIDSEVTEDLHTTNFGITADLKDCVSNTSSASIANEMLFHSEVTENLNTTHFGITANPKDCVPSSASIANEMLFDSEFTENLNTTNSGITANPKDCVPSSASIANKMLFHSEVTENLNTTNSGITTNPKDCVPSSASIANELLFDSEVTENLNTTNSGITANPKDCVPSSASIANKMLFHSEVTENLNTTNSGITANPKDCVPSSASNQIDPTQQQRENSMVAFDVTSADSGIILESSKCDSAGASKGSHEIKTGMEALVEIQSSQLQLKKEINKGAFGVVWKAVWNETIVAVKKIPIKRLKKCKHLLDRELKVNASVRHPNLVLSMGYNIEGNELQLVTEYLNGLNLDQVLLDDLGIELPRKKNIHRISNMCSSVLSPF